MRTVLLLLFLPSALACRAPEAAATAAAAPHRNCHPSCPGAHAPVAAPIAPLHEAVAFEAPASALAPSTAPFVCPMHAHVGANEPGRCPECGMQLVLRAAPEHDHDR